MKPHLLLVNDTEKYATFTKCMSYNAFLNIFVGGRGTGKTTCGLIYVGNRFVKYGEEFIYLRRYKAETKEFVSKHTLDNIWAGFITKGSGSGESYTITDGDNNTAGYLLTLSAQAKYKSANFSKVTTIIFDEVFIEKSRTYYLPDEVTNFLQLISTVQRTRTNLRVILLSNNNSLFNPYYEFFDIPDYEHIYYDRDRGIYCEKIAINPKLLEAEQATPLYKLTKDTAYGDYHYKNDVLRQRRIEVIPKPPTAFYYFAFVVNRTTCVCYKVNTKTGYTLWFICEDRKEDSKTFILFKDDVLNYFHAKRFKYKLYEYLLNSIGLNLVTYGDNKAYDVLNYVLEKFK